jgi:hypothetical protein
VILFTDWGFGIYFCSAKLVWGSGFGAFFMRERPFGGLLLIINMVMRGVGGVQMRSLGCMRWGFGKILGRFGRSFLALLVLRWVTVAKLYSCLIYGVRIKSSRKLFQTCLALPV